MRLHLFTASMAVAACGSPAERAAQLAADSLRADSTARARQDSINRARPDYVVDSIFPPEVAVARFRLKIGGDSVAKFSGGSNSVEALIERYGEAIARSDTTALRSMALNAREFADLFYLESPYAHPPYRQPPELAWRLLQSPSSEGLGRVLKEFGGKPFAYVRHSCDRNVAQLGRTRRHSSCLVAFRDSAGVRALRGYFGTILERDGQYKFLSYANRN